MLQFSKKKITIYALMLALASVSISGCNKADEQPAEEAAENPDAAGNQDDNNENPSEDTPAPTDNEVDNQMADGASADDLPESKQPIAERSPVEITRIEVDDPVSDTPQDSIEDETDDHNHEPVPNLFPIGECLVEVNGKYQVKLAKDLLKEINSRRADYGIGPLKQNTSLLACADSRCKEQTYFIGHFRPDGTAFNSVAPGYIQGECVAVEYRTVNEIMEAWFSVNKSRVQIMNPDYTQCGISVYDIDGTYYIAAEFAY